MKTISEISINDRDNDFNDKLFFLVLNQQSVQTLSSSGVGLTHM